MIRPTLLLAACLLAGCGGDPCEDAVDDLCSKACECEGDAACATAFGDGNLGLSFSDAEDCAAFFMQGCEEGVEDQIDGEACGAAVGSAECSEMGLLVPEPCGGG